MFLSTIWQHLNAYAVRWVQSVCILTLGMHGLRASSPHPPPLLCSLCSHPESEMWTDNILPLS